MPVPKDFVDVWIGLSEGLKYLVEGQAEAFNLSDQPCIFDGDGKELWILTGTTSVPVQFSVTFTATNSILYLGTKNRTSNAKFTSYTLKLLDEPKDSAVIKVEIDDDGMIVNPFTGRRSWL